MGDVGLARSAARKRFSEELRQVRRAANLSLRELERHTHASDSSLSRYLSGQSLPPWPVVEALCRLVGHDPLPLRLLWEAAKDGHPPEGHPPEGHPLEGHPLEEDGATYAESPPPPSPPSPPTGRRPWRALLILAVGVAVGLTVQPLARYLDGLLPHPGAAISGPYVSVDLLTAEGGTAPKVFWTMRARCGSADEYRLVYDLPPKEQGRATGYRVRHADCTVKLFDGLGGTGYGEALIPRGQPYRLSPRIAGRVVGMATYSCCNGRAALPRDAVLNQAATG